MHAQGRTPIQRGRRDLGTIRRHAQGLLPGRAGTARPRVSPDGEPALSLVFPSSMSQHRPVLVRGQEPTGFALNPDDGPCSSRTYVIVGGCRSRGLLLHNLQTGKKTWCPNAGSAGPRGCRDVHALRRLAIFGVVCAPGIRKSVTPKAVAHKVNAYTRLILSAI